MKTSSKCALALLTIGAGTLGTAPSAQAVRMFAIESPCSTLRSFDSDLTRHSALGGSHQRARRRRGHPRHRRPHVHRWLVVVTSANRRYDLNPVSGAAQVGAGAFSPTITWSVGMDFNPVSDRVRHVNDDDLSLRVNPVTGAVTQDTNLNPGDPNVTGAAYSNTFSARRRRCSTTSTRRRTRCRPRTRGTTGHSLPSERWGSMPARRRVVDVDSVGTAYAVLSVAGTDGLYKIDLSTGGASLLGATGASLDGLAVTRRRPPGARGPTVARRRASDRRRPAQTGGSVRMPADVTVGDGTAPAPATTARRPPQRPSRPVPPPPPSTSSWSGTRSTRASSSSSSRSPIRGTRPTTRRWSHPRRRSWGSPTTRPRR